MQTFVKMSSKGQIVVPKTLREKLGLTTGTSFAISGRDDSLILKKVSVEKAKKVFDRVHRWGVALAKRKGFKAGELMDKIHRGRGIKSA